jgi:hypothetical protein
MVGVNVNVFSPVNYLNTINVSSGIETFLVKVPPVVVQYADTTTAVIGCISFTGNAPLRIISVNDNQYNSYDTSLTLLNPQPAQTNVAFFGGMATLQPGTDYVLRVDFRNVNEVALTVTIGITVWAVTGVSSAVSSSPTIATSNLPPINFTAANQSFIGAVTAFSAPPIVIEPNILVPYSYNIYQYIPIDLGPFSTELAVLSYISTSAGSPQILAIAASGTTPTVIGFPFNLVVPPPPIPPGGGGSSPGTGGTVNVPPINQVPTPSIAPPSTGPSTAPNTSDSTTATTNPQQPPTVNRNVKQLGAQSALSCATRALKNIKLLQKKSGLLQASGASIIIPQREPNEGYYSITPLSGIDNINSIVISGSYGPNAVNIDENGKPIPQPAGSAVAPLFNGVLHIVQVTYQNNTSSFQVSNSDISTIQGFMIKAAKVIIPYTSQYGTCSLTIDPNIIQATLQLPGNSTNFNDQTLSGTSSVQGFVDQLASSLGLANTNNAFMIVGAPGVTNTDADPTQGVLGYHNATNTMNGVAVNVGIPYIYFGLTSGGLTPNDSTDQYQVVASHETSEMTVDPAANLSNPEVCDPCGPNCQAVIRDFFDNNGNYLFSSSFFPPLFTYSFMINAIVQPQYSSSCPAPTFSCAYSVQGQNQETLVTNIITQAPIPIPITIPNITLPVPYQVASGLYIVNFPNGTDLIQQVNTPIPNLQVIQLPLNGNGL